VDRFNLMSPTPTPFWSLDLDAVYRLVKSSSNGLSDTDAKRRLRESGPNSIEGRRRFGWCSGIWAQIRNPISLMLIASACLSMFLGEKSDAAIILAIMAVSIGLGVWQEHHASQTIEKLLEMVQSNVRVRRDGQCVDLPTTEIVVGDVLELSAGSSVPADCFLVETSDLFVNEATLTGETFPVDKSPGVVPAGTPLSRRSNSIFCGTHVESGTGRAVVVRTGRATEFGTISQRLELRPPETEFERGVRRFGYFLIQMTFVLILVIFAVNVALHRPVLQSLSFSLALAVGLTPQLLPAIISVNLAKGARRMSERHVIVRRLASIEDFGSMDVLCSDKTGTLTEGNIHVHSMLGADGRESPAVSLLAVINASLQSGYSNPIDKAICESSDCDISAWSKIGELPYDFIRKRLGILATDGTRRHLISKGAFEQVLSVCNQVLLTDSSIAAMDEYRTQLVDRFHALSEQGLRVLGVAQRDFSSNDHAQASYQLSKSDEAEMTFVGFIVLHDPPKADVAQTIQELRDHGVQLKMITGDNALVAANVAGRVGLSPSLLMTGRELDQLSGDALLQRAVSTQVFAEVTPNQKERVILALKAAGCVVGYLGDGINDAPALHAADVGISVDAAVDVAREAADIVLMQRDLAVLKQGIDEGRVTFANTLKYVSMATSANFGNMFSMAGASLFLNFLPLLPSQILLMNLLTDFPEMAIASDGVDPEMVRQPRRWNVSEIRNFMLVFGSISSIFDYLTFGALLFYLQADEIQFRTGWFLESVASSAIIVLVIRTRRPFWNSRPSNSLFWATMIIVGLTLMIPLTPFREYLSFTNIPTSFFFMLALLIAAFVGLVEFAKRWFYAVNVPLK
jgi:P-type Mg2+ transporter